MADDTATTPLLQNDAGDLSAKNQRPSVDWWRELRDLLHLAAPACLQLCAQQGLVVGSQVLVGHMGPAELAAASIGITWFNLLFYFMLGVTSALDTLGAQAYGANDRAAVLVWGWSCAIVLAALAFVMAGAMWVAPVVAIHFFRQPPAIAEMVGTYCRWMIPSLWPFVWAITLMKTMQAQNGMWVPAIATAFVCVANVGITWGLIQVAGFTGAAAATTVSRTLLFVICGAWVLIFGTGKPRADQEEEAALDEVAKGDSHKALATVPEEPGGLALFRTAARPALLWRFLQLGMPGAVMMTADASSFDITTAMAGLINTTAVDAHTIMLTLCVFIFISFPFGVATASTIRVGNLLGAGLSQQARASGVLCVAMGTLFLSVAGAAIFVLRYSIGSWFVDDPAVQEAVASIAPIAALYQFPDGILGTAGGVLRGMGRQAAIMIFNLAGFWGTGVPCGYVFTFILHKGVVGLWWGIFTGVCVTAVLCTVALLLTDWDKEAALAKQRAAQEAEEGQALGDDIENAALGREPAAGAEGGPGTSFAQGLRRPSMHTITEAMAVQQRPSLQRSSIFSHTSVSHGISYPSSLPKSGSLSRMSHTLRDGHPSSDSLHRSGDL